MKQTGAFHLNMWHVRCPSSTSVTTANTVLSGLYPPTNSSPFIGANTFCTCQCQSHHKPKTGQRANLRVVSRRKHNASHQNLGCATCLSQLTRRSAGIVCLGHRLKVGCALSSDWHRREVLDKDVSRHESRRHLPIKQDTRSCQSQS